jgi:hypothetical protein
MRALTLFLAILAGFACTSTHDERPEELASDPIIALNDQAGQLVAVDPASGDILWTIGVGIGALIAVRHEARQLLVVDEPPGREPSEPGRLRAFDISGGEPQPLYEVPITNRRAHSTIRWNNVALSGDERFLFFREHLSREDMAGCERTNPNRSGPFCDDMWVVAVDLEAGGEVQHRVRMPEHCGTVVFAPAAGSAAVAHCQGGGDLRLMLIDGDDGIVTRVEGGGAVGFQRPGGSLIVVTSWGVVGTPVPSEVDPEARVLPGGSELMLTNFTTATSGDDVILAYREVGSYMNGLHGLVRLDLDRLEVTQSIALDEAPSVVLRRDGSIAILQRDGSIEVVGPDGARRVLPVALWEVPADTSDWYEPDNWLLVD